MNFYLYRLLMHVASQHVFIIARFGVESVKFYMINDISGNEITLDFAKWVKDSELQNRGKCRR